METGIKSFTQSKTTVGIWIAFLSGAIVCRLIWFASCDAFLCVFLFLFVVFSKTNKQLEDFWKEYQCVTAINTPSLNDVFGIEVNGRIVRAQYIYEVSVVIVWAKINNIFQPNEIQIFVLRFLPRCKQCVYYYLILVKQSTMTTGQCTCCQRTWKSGQDAQFSVKLFKYKSRLYKYWYVLHLNVAIFSHFFVDRTNDWLYSARMHQKHGAWLWNRPDCVSIYFVEFCQIATRSNINLSTNIVYFVQHTTRIQQWNALHSDPHDQSIFIERGNSNTYCLYREKSRLHFCKQNACTFTQIMMRFFFVMIVLAGFYHRIVLVSKNIADFFWLLRRFQYFVHSHKVCEWQRNRHDHFPNTNHI